MRVFIAFLLTLIVYSVSLAEDLPYHEIDMAEKGAVNVIAWKPDESLLAVGGDGGIWFYNDLGQEVASLDSENVTDFAWSPNAETLAVSTADHKITFWHYQADGLTFEKTIQAEGDRINSLAFSPDEKYIAATSSDEIEYYSDSYRIFHRLRVYETATGALIFTSDPSGGILSHRYALNMIQWSADGERLLTFGGPYRNLVVYDANTWDILASAEHRGELITMTADPTLMTIFFSAGSFYEYDDYSAHLFQIYRLNNALLGNLSAYQEVSALITALVWQPVPHLVASAEESGDIRIWHLKNDDTAEPVSTLRAHLAPVRLLAWDSSGTKLAGADENNVVLIWHDIEQDYTPPGFYPTHTIPLPDSAQIFTWSGDGKWLVVGGEKELAFYDAARRVQVASIPMPFEGDIRQLQFSEDNTRLLISNYETIQVMAVAVDGDEITLSPIASHNPETSFGNPALSPDGTVVAYNFGFYGGGLEFHDGQPQTRLWNIDTGEIRELHTGYLSRLLWGPDSSMLLTGLQSQPLARIHDIVTDTSRVDFWGLQPFCCGSGYSPRGLDWQGDHVAMTSWGQVGIWQVEYSEGTLNITNEITFLRKITAVKLSPDGRLLAGVGENLYIWDTQSGRPLRIMNNVSDQIAWSPDGRTLASFDLYPDFDEKQLLLWEIDPNMASSTP